MCSGVGGWIVIRKVGGRRPGGIPSHNPKDGHRAVLCSAVMICVVVGGAVIALWCFLEVQ